ncbi:MAG: TetR family transcriptional regulator [Alphaproteobacteria bacterium]|nr:TetR family transcriptional regulator [Alphaproteobacteria bacterium]
MTQEDTLTSLDKIKNRILDAAMALAEARGWGAIGLADIAEAAALSLGDLRGHVEDKADILALLGRRVDRLALESAGAADMSVSVRDRLFDVLMERFEALNLWRGGVVSVLDSFKCDPKQAVIACPHLARSMSWMLEAAGEDTQGWRGALKVMGLMGVYIKVLRVWREDESADLARTMAALDKDLSRAEQAANTFAF